MQPCASRLVLVASGGSVDTVSEYSRSHRAGLIRTLLWDLFVKCVRYQLCIQRDYFHIFS